MAVISYHTLNAQVVGESTGAIRIDYLSDALGNVTGTSGSDGVLQNRYRYKPYGAKISETGSGLDPKFQWVGLAGYRQSQAVYVRARHYTPALAMWTSRDPLWPDELAYVYVEGRPTSVADVSGQSPIGESEQQSCQVPSIEIERKKGTCCYTRTIYPFKYSEDILNYLESERVTTLSTKCKALLDALRRECGFGDSALICRIFDQGKCCEAAKSLGVDPAALCGLGLGESSGRDLTNDVQDASARFFGWTPSRSGKPSVGCLQMQVGHARRCLDKLKRCNRTLYDRINPPVSDDELLRRLAADCAFSLRVAAACQYVHTKPNCTKAPLSPREWTRTWNPNNKVFVARYQCANDVVRRFNPCG